MKDSSPTVRAVGPRDSTPPLDPAETAAADLVARVIERSAWLPLLSLWAWATVATGAVAGLMIGDELRETRDAGLPYGWLSVGLAACVAMVIGGCILAIFVERTRAAQ